MDKDPGEVESYYHTFWKRYKELNDWEKYLQKIEKGEQKLEVCRGSGAISKAHVVMHLITEKAAS